MTCRLKIFLLVMFYLTFDGVSSHTFQHCKTATENNIKNETGMTQCIGITRFAFINLTPGSSNCSNNSIVTYPYQMKPHPCRLNRETIDHVFKNISCQQKATFRVSLFRCDSPFDVFKFDYDWVPLQNNGGTVVINNMTDLYTSNFNNITFVRIYNNDYGTLSVHDTIPALKLNCICTLTFTTTTKLILHTYDNRLTKNQTMTLLYENGTHIKSWGNETDLLLVVNTDEIIVDQKTLYLQWINEAETPSGHFWIGIEAQNSTFDFVGGMNKTKYFTQVVDTTTAPEIITESVSTPSMPSKAPVTTQTLENDSLATETTVTPNDKNKTSLSSPTSVSETSHTSFFTRTLTGDSTVMFGSSSSESSTNAASPGKSDPESNGNMGLIIGIVVGVLMLLLMIVVVCCCVRWCIMKKNRTRPEDEKTSEGEANADPRSGGMLQPRTLEHLPNPVNSRFYKANY